MNRRDFVLKALEEYEKRLTSYAYRLTGNLEKARDAVQETFLQLWRADLEKARLNWPAWLYAVCRYRVIDLQRKEKRLKPLSDHEARSLESNSLNPEQRLQATGEYKEVLDAVSELPEQQQEAIRLKFGEGLSYKEISSIMGLSTSHVGVLIHHGITALRERMKK